MTRNVFRSRGACKRGWVHTLSTLRGCAPPLGYQCGSQYWAVLPSSRTSLILACHLAQAGGKQGQSWAQSRVAARNGAKDLQETPPSNWERRKQTSNYNKKVFSWLGAAMLFLVVGFTRLEWAHSLLPALPCICVPKGEKYSREAVPPLADSRDSQQLREAQAGEDSKKQLIWKGVPGNTCKEAKTGFLSLNSSLSKSRSLSKHLSATCHLT